MVARGGVEAAHRRQRFQVSGLRKRKRNGEIWIKWLFFINIQNIQCIPVTVTQLGNSMMVCCHVNMVQSHYKKQLKFVSDSSVIYWQKKRVIGGVIFAMDGATIGDETRSVDATGFFVLLNAFHSMVIQHIITLLVPSAIL